MALHLMIMSFVHSGTGRHSNPMCFSLSGQIWFERDVLANLQQLSYHGYDWSNSIRHLGKVYSHLKLRR